MSNGDSIDTPTVRGWQAVYQLVQDSERRVLMQVGAVSEDVKGIKATMDTHLLGHAVSESANAERVRIAAEQAARRATNLSRVQKLVATTLPVPAAIVAILTAIKVFTS